MHFCIDQNRENIKRLIYLVSLSLLSLIACSQPTCKTSTYYLRFSPAAGEKIELRTLHTFIDANILVAGNITSAGGQQEGLLIKLDNAGAIINQTKLRVEGQPCTLYSAGTLTQGDLVIAGTINNGGNDVFVARLAPDLTTVWIKKYTAPATPLQVSMQLSENKRISLAIRINDAVVCAVMDLNGITGLSSQINVPGVTELTGFNYSNTSYLLTCNVLDAGNRFTRLVELNFNTGAITAGAQMGNGTDETQYGFMNRFSLHSNLLGIIKQPTGFSLIRNIIFNSPGSQTQHLYQPSVNLDWNSTVGMDNSARVLGVCVPQEGKLYFLRQPADYLTRLEFTKSYTVPVGAALKGVTACGDGGFLFGLNTNAGNEVILIKTDSIGTLPGCGVTVETGQVNEKINVPNTVKSFTATAQNVGLSPAAGSITTTSINTTFDCNQLYCPFIPNLDDCFTSYYKQYASHSFADGIASYFLLNNQNQILAGSRQDRYIGDEVVINSGVKLYNEKGRFVKGVKIFSDGKPATMYANKLDEHSFMVQSYDGSSGKTVYTFTLMSDNLDILWTKTLITNATFSAGGGFIFSDMYKDQEGNFYFLQCHNGFGTSKGKVLVYKMDALGNEVWLKAYELPTGFGGYSTMAITNTSLVIVMEGSTLGSTSIRLDKQTGNVLNAYRYAVGSGGATYIHLTKFDNDRIFYAGSDNPGRFLMATLDTFGLPTKMRYIANASSYRCGDVKNGFLYCAYDNVVIKIDTALDAVFKNEYPSDYGVPNGLGVADNGSIYMGGNNFASGVNGAYTDPYLIKLSALGERGDCPFTPGTLNMVDINPAPVPLTLIPYPVTFQPASKTITITPDDDGIEVRAIPCNNLAICSSIQVTGPDNICRQNVSYNFLVDKNITCKVLPQWTFDTAYATRIRNNSGDLELHFKKTGSVWVEAKVDDGCHVVTDRKLVNIQNDGASLALGNDSALCTGDSLLLKAGVGFNSYKWQDGSTGTEFMVKQAGQYFVETDNVCGERFYDTVNVAAVNIPPLDITGDTVICYDGSASLAAPGQFQTYRWQYSNGLLLSTKQTASFKVLQKEKVNLLVTTKEGCKANDSVMMEVKFARAIALGADTSLCSGDSVVLKAGTHYASYHWNTGNIDDTLIVKQAATYIVSALDSNNCMANDTLVIQQLYPRPQVNLGADRNKCEGQPLVLDAGQQSSYLWHDGSTNRYYNVINTGQYKVSVTNNFACVNADSINILKISPPPADFLTSHDSLCTYATLNLVPAGTYSDYLWSTGSSQRSITIDKPGVYILTVESKDGCSGSDTVQIFQKDCLAGVFIPNAFSPGKDGKNDVFRAMVYGETINFEIQVYNRYGQLVFTSKDPFKAWDGTVNGKTADAGTFVWQCRYYLKGDEPRYRKGTVVLVR